MTVEIARVPRIWRADDPGEAYDMSQSLDPIQPGDILVTPQAIAVLYRAWPVLICGQASEFHVLEGVADLEALAERDATLCAFCGKVPADGMCPMRHDAPHQLRPGQTLLYAEAERMARVLCERLPGELEREQDVYDEVAALVADDRERAAAQSLRDLLGRLRDWAEDHDEAETFPPDEVWTGPVLDDEPEWLWPGFISGEHTMFVGVTRGEPKREPGFMLNLVRADTGEIIGSFDPERYALGSRPLCSNRWAGVEEANGKITPYRWAMRANQPGDLRYGGVSPHSHPHGVICSREWCGSENPLPRYAREADPASWRTDHVPGSWCDVISGYCATHRLWVHRHGSLLYQQVLAYELGRTRIREVEGAYGRRILAELDMDGMFPLPDMWPVLIDDGWMEPYDSMDAGCSCGADSPLRSSGGFHQPGCNMEVWWAE